MIFQNCLKFHEPLGEWNYEWQFRNITRGIMPNITTNHAITYTNQDNLVLDVIHQNWLSNSWLPRPEVSKIPWLFPDKYQVSLPNWIYNNWLTVILGTHLFMLKLKLLAMVSQDFVHIDVFMFWYFHLTCTWIYA